MSDVLPIADGWIILQKGYSKLRMFDPACHIWERSSVRTQKMRTWFGMQRLAEKIRCFSRGSLPTDDMIPANRGISMASLDHFVAEVSEKWRRGDIHNTGGYSTALVEALAKLELSSQFQRGLHLLFDPQNLDIQSMLTAARRWQAGPDCCHWEYGHSHATLVCVWSFHCHGAENYHHARWWALQLSFGTARCFAACESAINHRANSSPATSLLHWSAWVHLWGLSVYLWLRGCGWVLIVRYGSMEGLSGEAATAGLTPEKWAGCLFGFWWILSLVVLALHGHLGRFRHPSKQRPLPWSQCALEAQRHQGNGPLRPLGHRRISSFHRAPEVAAPCLPGWMRRDRERDPEEHQQDITRWPVISIMQCLHEETCADNVVRWRRRF